MSIVLVVMAVAFALSALVLAKRVVDSARTNRTLAERNAYFEREFGDLASKDAKVKEFEDALRRLDSERSLALARKAEAESALTHYLRDVETQRVEADLQHAAHLKALHDKAAAERQHLDISLVSYRASMASLRAEVDCQHAAHVKGLRDRADAEARELRAQTAELKRALEALEEQQDVQLAGFYRNAYDFGSSTEYEARLDDVRARQQVLIKQGLAAQCTVNWTIDGSRKAGEKKTRDEIKLMLRAFNGTCDAAVAKVKYDNVATLERRVRADFEAINKLSATNHCTIAGDFLKLKLDELALVHGYQEKKQAELEEQRAIREQMRDEERARRELQKAQEDAERDEERFQRALAKAQQEVEQSAGHVYIISNVGSFGDHVFKIGMTRRLDPMDRVVELGDASVPFAFDVHAMIYTENAPELERLLHKRFHHRRVNKVNERKEFFRVTVDDIETAAHEIARSQPSHEGRELTFARTAKAEDYRKSISMRRPSEPPPAGGFGGAQAA